MGGDGQVTTNNVIMKTTACKVKFIDDDEKIAVGFAGSVADAISMREALAEKVKQYHNLERAADELGKEWRKKLKPGFESLMLAADSDSVLLIGGNGEVIIPDICIAAVGSGGNFALSAARSLAKHCPKMTARDVCHEALIVASELCTGTNGHFNFLDIKKGTK